MSHIVGKLQQYLHAILSEKQTKNVRETIDYFAHLLEGGYHIRMVEELLSHSDVKTTMMYIHVLNCGPGGVCSPVDEL